MVTQKHNTMKRRFMISAGLILAITTVVQAQERPDDNQPIDMGDMTIYNEYTPTIRDANRIQTIPVIVDTISVQPKFKYSIYSRQYATRYQPLPIQSADLKPEPLTPLDNGWIKFGIGNYLTPYIEANYHNLRSKDYSLGVSAKHHSSHGKIKNSISQRVYAGYNDNDISLYGKKFLNTSTLFGNVWFSSREDYFYGVNPNLFSGNIDLVPLNRSDMEKQRYSIIGLNAGINSNNLGNKDPNYRFCTEYHYLKAIDTTHQHHFAIDLAVNKNLKNLNIGADMGLKLYKTNIIDSSLLVPSIQPFVTYTNKQWQIRLGLTGTAAFSGDSSRYHLYPDVLIQHNISNTLIPYFGFSGNLQVNDMEHMAFENPYTTYRLLADPTSMAQIIDLGIKGNINRKIRFNLKGNYSKIDNMYFYVIDTTELLRNKFETVYSNVERFSGYGEIMVAPNDNLNIYLDGHYYWYSYIKSEDKPWHMPNFDIRIFASYRINKELTVGAGAYVTGTRYTKNFYAVDANDHNKLGPIIDVNLKAEYSFASNFSSFIYLNNIAAQKYYLWENYRAHGFNVLLGIKYAF